MTERLTADSVNAARLVARASEPLPDALIRVDLGGLRKAGYDIGGFTRVGRQFNMSGGGTELQFQRAIPPPFVRVVCP